MLFGAIHFIACLNCNLVNVAETGCIARIRIQENKRFLENYDCQSKITIHLINTDHVPNFDNLYFVNFYMIVIRPDQLTKHITVLP